MIDMAEMYRIMGKYYNPSDASSQMLYKPEDQKFDIMFGIVQDNKDPNKMFRVKVWCPYLGKDHTTSWIRIIRPYATAGAGAWFLPDIGERVVVVFIQHNVNHPLVLGSIYSKQCGIDPGENRGNVKKFFFARSGARVEFNDTETKKP